MAKEFPVPQVVFTSSDGNLNVLGSTSPAWLRLRPSTRRAIPAPSNPNIFMSFDVGDAQASSSFSAPSSRHLHEPPLFEELRKTVSILNPIRLKPNLHEDADLAGPYIFLMAFGLFQLLAGKFHYGIILGWVTVAAAFLYVVFNMVEGRNGNLDLYRCLSLVGYGMLPMVILSAMSLFVTHDGPVIFAIAAVVVLWSTRVCTGLLVELASGRDEHRGLIAYACWLVYMLFSLLIDSLYSDCW